MTSLDLANTIHQQAAELQQLIAKTYNQGLPSAIDQALVKQKCITLYDLLLQESTVENEIVVSNLPIVEQSVFIEEKPTYLDTIVKVDEQQILQESTLFKDTSAIIDLPKAKEDPEFTPTELQNKVIDEILEKQQELRIEPEIPKEIAHELSLNEKIANSIPVQSALADKLSASVQSLKTAINVNLKIAIVNQLFNENTVEYVKAIDKLNSSENLSESLRYFNELKHTYSWDNENALVKELEQLVQKRFA